MLFKKKPYETQKVGHALCKALGLDSDKIFFLQITCEVGDVTHVETKSYVYDKSIKKLEMELGKVTRKYILTEV